MHGAPVSPREPPMMNTLPELNFVEAAERRGTSRSTVAPISPASGRAGPPRGMPMSTTSTSPAYSLPGRVQTPTFGRWNVAVAMQCTAGPSTSPVVASTPEGMSQAITGAFAASISSITWSAGERGDPLLPGPEQAVDDHVRLVQPPCLERDRLRPGQLLQLRLRVLPHPLGRPDDEHLDVTPGLAQQPRGDDPVPAVVALAAHDHDPPGGRPPRHHAREPLARALHQLRRPRPCAR